MKLPSFSNLVRVQHEQGSMSDHLYALDNVKL